MAKVTGLESVGRDSLAAELTLPPPADLRGMQTGSLTRLLLLDGVQDPGNLVSGWAVGVCVGDPPISGSPARRPSLSALCHRPPQGTLLRTALALGWQAAVLLPGCCDPFNDKALAASRGAAFRLPLVQLDVQQWQELVQLHDLTALAADPDRHGWPAAGDGGSISGGSGGGGGGATSLGEVQQSLGQLRVCLCLGAEGQGLSQGVRQHCRQVSIPQSGTGEGPSMESLNVSAAGAILMFALSRGAAPLLEDLASS